jgi:molybdopterin converting factor small subunit
MGKHAANQTILARTDMQVTFVAMGHLEKDFGEKRFTFDLPPGSTLADFLKRFGDEFAGRIPAVLWNQAESRFRGPVVMMANGAALRDPAEILRDGQEILIFNVLVGG